MKSEDIIKIIEWLKFISKYTIGQIFEEHKDLRFHLIDLKDKPKYITDIYKKTINFNNNDEQLPNLWQLEVFTDNKRNVSPRIMFYILIDGSPK